MDLFVLERDEASSSGSSVSILYWNMSWERGKRKKNKRGETVEHVE